jgi:succinyl-diaminopimelate desuccinylase
LPGSLERALIGAVAAQRDSIIGFTRDLVSIPTEDPPGRSYRQCVNRISDELAAIGIDHEIVMVPAEPSMPGSPGGLDPQAHPRYCALGTFGQGRKVVHFHGHYDVVPAHDRSQFLPRIEDGRLYGRGSSDMKAGLAAMVYAVKAVKAAKVRLGGRIALTMVPDEEIGGWWGSRYLAVSGMLGKDGIAMFTPEPTGGVIWNASRGAVTLRISVVGKATHVVTHYEGSNAFEQMLKVANRLLELKEDVADRTTTFNIQPDAARNSILMLGGRCEGGTNFNVVPGRCSFTVERRFNPEESLEEERKRILDLIARSQAEGVDCEVEIIQEGSSSSSEENDPVGQALAMGVDAVTGRRPPFELCPGLLETRYYSDMGIPAYGYGPGLLSVSHGADEYVVLDNIETCATAYAIAAVRLLGT